MPRQFGSIHYRFWTGATGRALRGDANTQVLAAYLATCGAAHMSGVYAISLPSIAHETGIALGEPLNAALRKLEVESYAFYDDAAEIVWVPRLAHFNVGPSLKATDNNRIAIARHLSDLADHRFVEEFLQKYGEDYNLTRDDIRTPPNRYQKLKTSKQPTPSDGGSIPPSQPPSGPPSDRVSTDPIRTRTRSEAEAERTPSSLPTLVRYDHGPAREPTPPSASEQAKESHDPAPDPLVAYLRADWPELENPVAFAAVNAKAHPGLDLVAEAKRARAAMLAGNPRRKEPVQYLADWFRREAKGPPLGAPNGSGPPRATTASGRPTREPERNAMSEAETQAYFAEQDRIRAHNAELRKTGWKPPKLAVGLPKP